MAAKLTADEVARRMALVPAWSLDDETIARAFKFRDFAAAMVFVNAVADAAERANHHPDIDIRWNTVRLALTTHSARGLTEGDFLLAREIDSMIA
jgi:4a-hydroxytetrahydrobiopterin dehydratase